MKRRSIFAVALVSLGMLGASGASAAQAEGPTLLLFPNCFVTTTGPDPGQLIYAISGGLAGFPPHIEVVASGEMIPYGASEPETIVGPARVETDSNGSFEIPHFGSVRATSYTLRVDYGGETFTKTLPVLCADFSDTEIDFAPAEAPVPVGSDSETRSVSLSNAGSADLDVSALSVVGDDAADFTLFASDCVGSLAPDESCEARVRFSPQAEGDRKAVLTAETNASNSPTVKLSGTATHQRKPNPGSRHHTPKLRLKVLKRHVSATVDAILLKGIRSKVVCSISCRVGIQLKLKEGSRRALGIDSPVLGATTKRVAAHKPSWVIVRIRPAAARALRAAPAGAAINFTTSYRARRGQNKSRRFVLR